MNKNIIMVIVILCLIVSGGFYMFTAHQAKKELMFKRIAEETTTRLQEETRRQDEKMDREAREKLRIEMGVTVGDEEHTYSQKRKVRSASKPMVTYKKSPTLVGGHAACGSEKLYDELTNSVANEDKRQFSWLLKNGCFITKSGVPVSILELGFGTSKVRAYAGDKSFIIWTATKNINR